MTSFKKFQINESKNSLAEVNIYPIAMGRKTKDGYIFNCQHGEKECLGQAYEVCATSLISKNDYFDLMICFAENIFKLSNNFDKTLELCVSDETVRKQIVDCSKSNEGGKLRYEIIQKTPKLTYVPWIQVNGVQNVDKENKIVRGMVDYLCSIRKDEELQGCINP